MRSRENRLDRVPLGRFSRSVLLLPLMALSVAGGCDKGGSPTGADAGKTSDKTEAPGKDAAKDGKHADEAKLSAAAVGKYGVKVEKAGRRVLTPTVAVPARVSYNLEQVSHVGVPVAGRVAEMKVRLGDTVKKGDVLIVVDSPELGEAQSDYLQKRTTVDVARPAVELAQSSYERAEQLLKESQGIALTEVQKRKGELQAARGALQTASAAVVATESKLELLGLTPEAVAGLAKGGKINAKFEVRAPLAGQVVQRDVTLGELVRPEKEALVVVADLSTLWVIADLPQASLPSVAVGGKARITAATGPEAAVVEGKISYISPQIDTGTRTGQVRIEVKADGITLRAGMFVQAEIELAKPAGAGEAVLAVPDGAVQTVEGGPAVFVPVKGEENTFAKRAVSVGDPVGGWVQILSGLKEGQEVVVAGSFILKAELGKSSTEE